MKRIVQASRRRRALAAAAAILVTAGGLQFWDVNPAASQTAALPAYEASSDPGLDPADAVWHEAVSVRLPLSAQASAYAAGGGGVDMVTAKSLHYKDRLYLRVEWKDSTNDNATTRVEDFTDAVAVEFPAGGKATIPSLCMGQADAAVNIWQWRADSQAGFGDPTRTYVNALVDGYPSKDDLWYPARFSGNPVANPDAGPVQTLVARAFGTLAPANAQDVAGKGVYANGTWAVVFSRSLAGSDADQASFALSRPIDVAFAVWNGSDGDRNGRKSVSQFARMNLVGIPSPGVTESNTVPLAIAFGLLVGFSGLGLAIAFFGLRVDRRS